MVILVALPTHAPIPVPISGDFSATLGLAILTVLGVRWSHNASGPATVAAARGRDTGRMSSDV